MRFENRTAIITGAASGMGLVTAQQMAQEGAVVYMVDINEERLHQEAAAIRQKASADILQEKKKAINDAKDEISEMAVAIAEKVVGRALSEADQASLVDHFIEELGEQE